MRPTMLPPISTATPPNSHAIRLCCRTVRLELLALFVQPRALRRFAGFDKIALRVGDLGRRRVTGGHPSPRRVDVVPAQEQRFGTSSLVPTPRLFSESRVLANPVEVDPQRLSELR